MAVILQHEKYGDIKFPNGTTDEQLAQYLVELEAAGGKQYGIGETIANQVSRSFTSSMRGIGKALGSTDAEDDRLDNEAEFKSRVQMEQNPVSSVLGMLGGAVFDPVTIPVAALKPIKMGSKIGTYATRGAIHGATGGLVEPVYEQYGDSTVANIFAGTIFGGGLGAGTGKIFGKSSDELETKDTKTSTDSDAPQAPQAKAKEPLPFNVGQNVEDILTPPPRTVDQANAKILEELELEAKGAPSQQKLDDLDLQLKVAKKESAQLGVILAKLTGGRAKAGVGKRKKIPAKSAQAKIIEARAVETNNRIKQLELELAEGTTKRKAAINYEKAKSGKFSKVEGYDQRLEKATAPLKRTPIAQAVSQPRAEQAAAPAAGFVKSRPVLARKLGLTPDVFGVSRFFKNNQSVGAARATNDASAREAFMPRSRVQSTEKYVKGKYNSDNKETTVPLKISDQAKADILDAEAKLDRGEKLTPIESERYARAVREEELLREYADSSAQIAASRGLDTYANRFGGFGRYTFENIQRRSNKFLKDEGIDDINDMIEYILANPNKLFNAAELNGMSELLMEVDQKLLELTVLTRHTENMTDAEIALLHNDIDVFYGIQSWFKGQGSKAAGVFTARKKLYKDIANNREITQLYAGVEC